MKLIALNIHNIGMIADEHIKIDKPLILFYGEIRQGKSTILNCVKWCCGGSFPTDIIRHGQREAHVELTFANGSIRREWYVAKDQTTKARPIAFIRDGKSVKNPVDEIAKMLNPFLLNQDYLQSMTELERKKYFAELFAVKTDDLDEQVANIDREARDLRAKIKGYGDIDLTPVKPIDVTAVKAELDAKRDEYRKQMVDYDAAVAKASSEYEANLLKASESNNLSKQRDNEIASYRQARENHLSEIEKLEQQIKGRRDAIQTITQWLEDNRPLKPVPMPESPIRPPMPPAPDTAALEAKLSEASAVAVRVEQYHRNKSRAEDRSADELALSGFEKRLRELRDEKIARLKNVSNSSGIAGLAFDENGDFTYEGTQAGMLSTSQLMKLSKELSAMYPEGFGVDLIDRGESLGKSIFAFVEKAKANNSTILATIVGEKPAEVPEDVGVFVVEQGKVK